MNKLDAFTPDRLQRVRKGISLPDCGLVPVDDPSAWELIAAAPDGVRNAWKHTATGWLSQTLSAPKWALEEPEMCRKALARGVMP